MGVKILSEGKKERKDTYHLSQVMADSYQRPTNDDVRPVSKSYFQPTDEILGNPFIGFVSFNHFRGDPLFSETGTIDGWKKERYPVYDFVEEKGDLVGWHPDTEMAYIRILWRDFEPEEGKYCYELMDDILAKAKTHRQYVMLRLMPHTTMSFEDVPDWLREQIPCPDRPDGARVKDSPTDPTFYEKFARAIRAIAKRYDSDPVLYAVDIALSGAWGEGHNYKLIPEEAARALLDSYCEGFRNTHLFGQICAPEFSEYCRQTHPIGWRADGFGEPYHMQDYLPKRIHPQMSDYWKEAPVSCEAFWYMNEWERQGWDIDVLADQAIRWHISTFNNKHSPIPYKWYPAIRKLLIGMGYRFVIRAFECPLRASSGEEIDIYMWLENRGNAPIYNRIPLRLRLKNASFESEIETGLDITRWMPGDTCERFKIHLPEGIPAGTYRVELRIGGSYPEAPLVKLAMDAPLDEDWYVMTEMEVGSKER